MPEAYSIPDLPDNGLHRCEEVIKRSRFMASFAHTATRESARIFIDRIRQEFPDATHHCWAFLAGPPGDTGHAGYSDDGEPSGTAGRPMLTVLQHCGVGEIAVVVTRYFGGVKLGTGGLVRAYQGLVSLGLESLPRQERVTLTHVEIVLGYAQVASLRRLLPEHRASLVQELFEAEVTCQIALPAEGLVPFSSALANATGGSARIRPLD